MTDKKGDVLDSIKEPKKSILKPILISLLSLIIIVIAASFIYQGTLAQYYQGSPVTKFTQAVTDPITNTVNTLLGGPGGAGGGGGTSTVPSGAGEAGQPQGGTRGIQSTEISSCDTTISTPGAYHLSGDLTQSTGTCITIQADNVTIEGNGYTIIGGSNTYGILISTNGNNLIINNIGIRSDSYGITFSPPSPPSNITIKNSRFSGISSEVISISGGSKVYIINNTLDDVSGTCGVFVNLDSINGGSIANNTLTNANGQYLFDLNTVTNMILDDNQVITASGGDRFMYLYNSDYNNFTNNYINAGNPGSSYGIGLYIESGSTNNYFINNTVFNTYYQIVYLSGSNTNYFYNNNFSQSSNGKGVDVTGSSNCKFINNTISNTADTGLYLDSSSQYNTILNNTISNSNNNYGIYVGSSCDHNNITNNTLSSNPYGFMISGGNNNLFLGNTIFGGSLNYGIQLSSGDYNVFNQNTISSFNSVGLLLTGGSYNNYTSFTISSGVGSPTYGIDFGCCIGNGNYFKDITISSMEYGLYLESTISSTIFDGFTISSLTNVPIFFGGSVTSSELKNFEISSPQNDVIRINSGTNTDNNFTNITITNPNPSYYDINLLTDSNDRNYIIDSSFTRYNFAGTGVGSQLYFKNSTAGQILFDTVINGTGEDLRTDIAISNNLAFVNSSVPGLNVSADITLYNIPSYTQPIILRDGVACPDTICTNLTALTGNVIVSVTGWSNYSIGENATAHNFLAPNDATTNADYYFNGSISGNLTNGTSSTTTQNISVLDSSNRRKVRFTANFASQNVDLSALIVRSSSTKTVATFTGVTGISSTHILYVPITDSTGIYVCPSATDLAQVTTLCSGAVGWTYTEASGGTTKTVGGDSVTVSIDGSDYKIDGLSGSGAAEGLLTNLTIWDDSDSQTIYTDNNTYFYANFTDASGQPANTSDGGCKIDFAYTSSYDGFEDMTYDAGTALFEFNRTFDTAGTYSWKANCTALNENIQATDSFTITSTGGGGGEVPEYSTIALIAAIAIAIASIFFIRNRQN